MISVILNVYKRPYTLEAQIKAIKEQSIPIKSENIHVWYDNVEGGVITPKRLINGYVDKMLIH
jgi:hypothetical protein